jgi:hypothetical protein
MLSHAADFKSAVSTDFTTAALAALAAVASAAAADRPRREIAGARRQFGNLEAGVGIEPASTDLQSAAWPLCHPAIAAHCSGAPQRPRKKGSAMASLANILERETSLELATSTLARLRSTN